MNGEGNHPRSHAEFAALEAAVAADDVAQMPPASGMDTTPVVIRGATWTVYGFVAMQVARFVFNLILTRLVEKRVFGVINTSYIYLNGLHMFSDLGIRQCVVNSPRGDEPRFLNTAWTIQVIRGLLLWAASFAVCAPMSWWYDEPLMLWLLPLLGASAVFDGLTATAAMTMSRQLRRDRIVVREVGSYAVSTGVMVAWLALLRWLAPPGTHVEGQQLIAFAGGSLLGSLIDCLLSYTYLPKQRDQFGWDRSVVHELVHFGGWIFISTACTYLAANLDRIYVSTISQETMADYHIAAQLARLPTLLIATLGHQLVFPLYSNLLRAGVKLEEAFARVHCATTGFAAWLIAGAYAACPTLVLLCYREDYAAAADYVRWLSVAAWFTVLQTSSEVVLLAQGRTRQVATGQIIKLVLLAPLLLLGNRFDGIRGVTIAYAIAEAARYLVLSVTLIRAGLPIARLDFGLTLLLMISAGLAQWVGPMCEGSGNKIWRFGPRFVAEGLIVTVFWAGVLAAWWPRHGRRLLHILRNSG